ncbi:MAG: hypothetical protein IIA50_03085 [Bacteroidetes bacterium]|nr:hypothetical protein [Bacteroidota bacterium]
MKKSRPDGIYAKNVHPYRKIIVQIQPTKTESQVAFDIALDAEPFMAYMKKAKDKFPLDYTHAAVAAVGIALIKHPELNRFIRSLQESHPPPARSGKRPHIIYSVQAETEPPTIILFVRGGDLSVDYLRFIENRLRELHDFTGTPLRVVARRRKGRYE